MDNDLYKILNVATGAEPEVVQAAYRALAKKFSGDDKKMRLFNEAKEVLTNAAKRDEYDRNRGKHPGKVIGQYRLIKQIAEGGFGVTYQGEHVTLGTPVCLKHAGHISPLDEQVLLDEAKAIWDLRHWGIPAIRDILRVGDDSLILVMSYVPGPTLAQLKDDHYPTGIDPEHVAWIAERVLNILHYLHLHGVVHGDMKPQNVIVQPDSHTVVTVDYGLSVIRPSKRTGAKGYTPYFAAPEQMDGRPPLPETDFYGLGMSLIYALGGDVAAVKVPGTVPEPFINFIKKLVRRNPLSRPKWEEENLCETIKQVRVEAFGRAASSMKPLVVS